MESSRFRGGGTPSLDQIRSDLENAELTMTQRRQAFDDLRRYLQEHPDDRDAQHILRSHQEEFVGAPAEEAPRATEEHGIGAVGAAQRKAGGDPFGKAPEER